MCRAEEGVAVACRASLDRGMVAARLPGGEALQGAFRESQESLRASSVMRVRWWSSCSAVKRAMSRTRMGWRRRGCRAVMAMSSGSQSSSRATKARRSRRKSRRSSSTGRSLCPASQVEVWIQQLDGGEVRYYFLPGADPDSSELPGFFDRNGFLP